MRDLDSDFQGEIAKAALRVGILCEIMYPATPLRTWSGLGDLAWDSKTWKGLGDLGGMSAIQERAGAQAGAVKLTLAGVADAMRGLALANSSASCSVRIWLAVFAEDPDTGAWSVLGAPWLMFPGISDVHLIASGTIELAVETALARLRQAKIARYTTADQQRHFPTDRGFDQASVMNTQPLFWGAASPVVAGGDVGIDNPVDNAQ